MKTKILHILNTSSFSGAENVAITIINNMNSDYECAYASYDGSIREELDKNNIQFFSLNSMSIFEIRRICRLFKPDVIHAHDYTASIISALSGVKVSIISHLHNNSPWIKTYHPYSFVYLLSALRYKKILGVSDSIFKEYVFGKNIVKKSVVISNPINIQTILEKAKQAKNVNAKYDVVFLGRLATQKNPLRFIELIKKISVEYPRIRVAMIGDGNLKEDCINKISNLDLSYTVDILGFLSNPYGILANSKILCMTSNWEGFGLVAVEALSLGIPVVATPVGGLPGIVDQNCGVLTNDDHLYISEVIKLLENRDYRTQKSKMGIKKAEMLNNIKSYIENLCKIYYE
ncbi:glycosyltransferase [Clostridium sp. DL1XJH146]